MFSFRSVTDVFLSNVKLMRRTYRVKVKFVIMFFSQCNVRSIKRTYFNAQKLCLGDIEMREKAQRNTIMQCHAFSACFDNVMIYPFR